MLFAILEDVIVFAGPDYEVAAVPPRARGLLSPFDTRSTHNEVPRFELRREAT